jgi:hypothetical protein
MSGRATSFLVLLALVATGLGAMAPPAYAAPIAYSVQDLGDGQLYTIDLATGQATAVGPTGTDQIDGIALDRTGVLYGIDVEADELVTIDKATGTASTVGSLGFDVGDTGISFDRNGVLYMVTEVPGNLYTVNVNTGLATLVGAQGQGLAGLAITCADAAFALGEDTSSVLSVDLQTAAATTIGPTGGVSTSNADLALDSGGTLWGINSGGQIFTVAPTTGQATVVSNTAPGFENLAITPLVCETPPPPAPPEPPPVNLAPMLAG